MGKVSKDTYWDDRILNLVAIGVIFFILEIWGKGANPFLTVLLCSLGIVLAIRNIVAIIGRINKVRPRS